MSYRTEIVIFNFNHIFNSKYTIYLHCTMLTLPSDSWLVQCFQNINNTVLPRYMIHVLDPTVKLVRVSGCIAVGIRKVYKVQNYNFVALRYTAIVINNFLRLFTITSGLAELSNSGCSQIKLLLYNNVQQCGILVIPFNLYLGLQKVESPDHAQLKKLRTTQIVVCFASCAAQSYVERCALAPLVTPFASTPPSLMRISSPASPQ